MPNLNALPQNVIKNQGTVALGANLILITPRTNIGIRPKGNKDQSLFASLISNPDKSIFFDILGEESITLATETTDHYLEDNTAVQDQTAIKPVMFTMTGYISEVNNVVPRALETIKNAATKLTVLSPYVPVLSAQALIIYNQVEQAYRTGAIAVAAAQSVWNSFVGGDQTSADGSTLFGAVQNKQQIIFQSLFNYWQNKQLFDVQTPWAVHQNMVIQSLRATQTEETQYISEFEITFKQLRFVSTEQDGIEASVAEGRRQAQAGLEVPVGSSTGAPSTKTLAGQTALIGG